MDERADKFNRMHEGQFVATEVPASLVKKVRRLAKGDDREILYYYLVEMCRLLKDEGGWQSPDPAPLTVAEIERVFERVREHPFYKKGQTFTTHTPEGVRVWLKNGIITVREKGEGWDLTPLADD